MPSLKQDTSRDDWVYFREMPKHNGMIVAAESMPLRSVFPLIADLRIVECILDSGSSIVGVSRAIWQSLGQPLDPGRSLTMQNANASENSTMGLVRNIKFAFGDMELFIQVQVIDHAAYDILLGRPFFTLTECLTQDRVNGEQQLTITDPNSGRALVIATEERGFRRARRADFRESMN